MIYFLSLNHGSRNDLQLINVNIFVCRVYIYKPCSDSFLSGSLPAPRRPKPEGVKFISTVQAALLKTKCDEALISGYLVLEYMNLAEVKICRIQFIIFNNNILRQFL